jgi:DNA-binding transcriptional LysR family regulator
MPLNRDRRYFLLAESVRLGTVRAAADSLNLAPSAISRQIAQLEHELGTVLIERHNRGVKPTEAGRVVLEFFREHQDHHTQLMAALQSLKGLHSGKLSMVVGEVFLDALSRPLARFSRRHPQIELSITVCAMNQALRQVIDDEADLGLVFNPRHDPKLRCHIVASHPVCLIVNPDHALATRPGPVALKGLDDYALALPDVSYGIRQLLAHAEAQAGVQLKPTLTCNALALLKIFAKEGGMTVLPRFYVQQELDTGTLIALPLEGATFSTPEHHLISRLGRKLSDSAHAMLSFLKKELPELGAHDRHQ